MNKQQGFPSESVDGTGPGNVAISHAICNRRVAQPFEGRLKIVHDTATLRSGKIPLLRIGIIGHRPFAEQNQEPADTATGFF